jgi:hypothetical protein
LCNEELHGEWNYTFEDNVQGFACKFGLVPRVRKKMKMVLERVMRRFECRKIINDMKKEINMQMGVNMMMQNMVMV